MSKPKYLPIPKKIPYNIRMPQHLLDKLNAYAELTGNTTTDVVIGALNDFIKDKTVYNDYLANINGLSFRLPILSSEKCEFYNVNLIGDETAADLFHEVLGYKATTEPYEILKIPNNLDIFSESFGYYSIFDKIGMKGNHSGIEFVVIPDVYGYYSNEDVIDALYCFYFETNMNKLKSVKLIDYMDAINKANDSANATLKNNLISCVNELAELENKIDDGAFDGVETVESGVDVVYAIVDELESIAKKYNTGNIIPLGENIDAAVVTAKVNENPELYDVFMDDVKDSAEKYVNDVIADRVADIVDYRLQNIEKLVQNAKCKDDIQTAISDNKLKIKTKKD